MPTVVGRAEQQLCSRGGGSAAAGSSRSLSFILFAAMAEVPSLEDVVRGAAQGAAAGGATRQGIGAAVASAAHTWQQLNSGSSCKQYDSGSFLLKGQILTNLAADFKLGHIGDLKRELRKKNRPELAKRVEKLSKARNLEAHPPHLEGLVQEVREALSSGSDNPKCEFFNISDSDYHKSHQITDTLTTDPDLQWNEQRVENESGPFLPCPDDYHSETSCGSHDDHSQHGHEVHKGIQVAEAGVQTHLGLINMRELPVSVAEVGLQCDILHDLAELAAGDDNGDHTQMPTADELVGGEAFDDGELQEQDLAAGLHLQVATLEALAQREQKQAPDSREPNAGEAPATEHVDMLENDDDCAIEMIADVDCAHNENEAEEPDSTGSGDPRRRRCCRPGPYQGLGGPAGQRQ